MATIDDGIIIQNKTDGNSTMLYDSTGLEPILVPIAWSLIVVVGGLGNGLVIYVIISQRTLKVTNCFIVNLAITDLAFLFTCVTFTMTFYITPAWIFGQVMCKFVMFMIYVSMLSTSLTLTGMTLDRYCAIVHPLKSMGWRTSKVAFNISVSIWIVSFLLSIPFAMYHDLVSNGKLNEFYCESIWPNSFTQSAVAVSVVTITYIIPLSVILICYSIIIDQLSRDTRISESKATLGHRYMPANASNTAQAIQSKNRKKVVKMVAVIVIFFAAFWLPIHVLTLWINLDPNFPRSSSLFKFKIFAHTLSYANSCVNPIVYSFMGDGFKRAFRKAFPRLGNQLPANGTALNSMTSVTRSAVEHDVTEGKQNGHPDSTANCRLLIARPMRERT